MCHHLSFYAKIVFENFTLINNSKFRNWIYQYDKVFLPFTMVLWWVVQIWYHLLNGSDDFIHFDFNKSVFIEFLICLRQSVAIQWIYRSQFINCNIQVAEFQKSFNWSEQFWKPIDHFDSIVEQLKFLIE